MRRLTPHPDLIERISDPNVARIIAAERSSSRRAAPRVKASVPSSRNRIVQAQNEIRGLQSSEGSQRARDEDHHAGV